MPLTPSPLPRNSRRGCALLLTLAALAALTATTRANDWPQWRGPNRDGISAETGLLKEWPEAGPTLVWQIATAGSGYATPSVVGDRLYLLGNEGVENESVRAFAARDGKLVWETRLGKVGNPNQQPKFPAARSTPTVDGDVLYALSSDGDLACVEIANGKIRWQKNLRTDFGGKPGIWAYSESPLVDGNTLVCSPGGSQAALVALDKRTGAVQWQLPLPEAEDAAYSSAMVVEADGVRQYVQMLHKGLVGVDAKSGKLLWRYEKTSSSYKANIPTPLVHGNQIYSAGAGTGGGLVRVKASPGGTVAEPVYFSPKMPTAIGGAVRVGDLLYGTTGQGMLCVEFATGTVKWEERALGAASLCFADNRLYLNAENGEVGLVEPSPEGFRLKGRFTPPGRPTRSQPMEKGWAYPVVSGGRLYLRDHQQLWCYELRSTLPTPPRNLPVIAQ
jgi:outer membrane protein assembly factor BamB